MIILSQDEEKIVNFDNVESIGFIEFTDYIGIKAKFSDSYIDLGKYKSIERAKEVLKEIITIIYGKSFVESTENTLKIHSIEQKVFYMPKE